MASSLGPALLLSLQPLHQGLESRKLVERREARIEAVSLDVQE